MDPNDFPKSRFSFQGVRESLKDDSDAPLGIKCKFVPFTAESYQRLLLWEAIEKQKETERNARSQEAHLKDGELRFGMDESEDKVIERNPDLEEGKALKPEFGSPPAYYMGLPLEEIDKGVTDKTFIVLSRWLNTIQISRFSASPAFLILPATSPVRRLGVFLCTNQIFDFFILFTILSNCICLAIPEANDVAWLEYLFFLIYSIEMVIKLLARGLFLTNYTYLRDPWNWLDMIVIALGIPSIALRSDRAPDSRSSSNASATQALRTFRVLRAVKTISIFPGLKTIVNAMLRAIKMLLEVVLLTMFCLLVFSLVSVQIYRGTLRQKCVRDPVKMSYLRRTWESYGDFYRRMLRDPENWMVPGGEIMLCGNNTGSGYCPENYTCQGDIGENPNFGFMSFDDVYASALIMFQLMTIDFWENAYRKVLLTNGYLAVIFFILTVFFGSFYLLNLMLAVVTITYQEEAEKTHKEMESENASKRQRKQAVGSFYNMTTMATKQHLLAKLIQENKQKNKDKENPLQKLVRLRTAIHMWKKTAHPQRPPYDPGRAQFFQEYATKKRSALDVMQNVAFYFKKWRHKTSKHGPPSATDPKKLRFNVVAAGAVAQRAKGLTPDFTPTPSMPPKTAPFGVGKGKERSDAADPKEPIPTTSGDRDECLPKTVKNTQQRGSLVANTPQTPEWKQRKTGRRSSADCVVDPVPLQPSGSKEDDRSGKLRMTTGKKPKDFSQNRGDEDEDEHSHPVASSHDHNTNAERGSANSSQTKLLTGGQRVQEKPFATFKANDDLLHKSDTSVDPPKKVFTNFAQVGRQLLLTAKSNMDIDKSPASQPSASFERPTRQPSTILSAWRESISASTKSVEEESPPKHCAPLINAIQRLGSRVQSMVNKVASDIFFDLFINFCIILNTILMSLNHHGMTDELAFIIAKGGEIFTLVFDLEAILKLIGFGIKGYFQSKWNRFDFVIAVLSSISVGVELSGITRSKGAQFLRAFRLLRVLKLAQVWPAMNHLLSIIANALAALGQLTIILGIILYIFAIIGLQLFKDKYNNYQFPNGIPRWNFKDFFHSFILMFRVLCGEWIEPLWDCMKMRDVHNSICMMVFLPTLIFGNFVVLNLFLALLLNSFGGEDTGTDTQMSRRLKEAKQRFSKTFNWLYKLCCPKKEIHLTIHRPQSSDLPVTQQVHISKPGHVPPWKKTSYVATCTPPKNVYNKPPPVAAALNNVDVIDEKDSFTMSKEESVAAYTSYTRAKPRRGAVRAHDVFEMKKLVPTLDVDVVPSCFPKWFQKRFENKISLFNAGDWGMKWTVFRSLVVNYVKTDVFEYVVLFVIIVSSILLSFEDYEYQHTTQSFLRTFIMYANYTFAVLFTVEMVLRWIAFGLTSYFTNAWTLIDFIVVVVSVIAIFSSDAPHGSTRTITTSNLSIFRALRAFRPLRVVSRIQGMKIVVNSLMRAIPAILNVFMVSLLFWLIFCVMGVQFFSGKFYKCIDRENGDKVPNISTRAECDKYPEYVWFNSYINFDNVIISFLALFQVATFEGWMEIMEDAVDSTEVDHQPKLEASLYTYVYFVIFIICGSFFSLNLVIGVIIDNFNILKKKYEGSYLDGFLTPNQRNYYNTLKKMSTRKPQRIITPPESRFQLVIYNLSISDRFELLVMAVVFLNLVVVGVQYSHYKLPCTFYEVLWVLEVGFCGFFIFEAALKIIGLRMYYFTLPWNCYDFIVAVFSFVDVAVHLFHQYKGLSLKTISEDNYSELIESTLIFSPVFLRLLRVFRISRVLRIIKVAKGLRKVVFSLVISLPAIINIMALLLLCLYIYAIVGMFLFSNVKLNGALDRMMNFRSFRSSALLLLSLSTAAGWNDVLDPLLATPPFCNATYHHMDDGTPVMVAGGDCGRMYVATPYMVSYIILTYLFIINMYIAVILENYNQAHQQEEVGVTEDDFDMFYSVWQRYDPRATQFIPYTQLSDFVADLDTPLGIPKPNEIALVSINLPILQGDKIHCLDILLALVRNVLTEIDESDEMFTLKQQINTKFKTRFPNRAKVKMISTTIERKKEDVAARTLQRAWQVFKTRQITIEGLQPHY